MKFKVRTEKGVWEVDAADAAAAQLKAEARGHTVVEVVPMTTTPLEPAYQDAPEIAALAEEIKETRELLRTLVEATTGPRWYDDRRGFFKVIRDSVVWGIIVLLLIWTLIRLVIFVFTGMWV